MVQDGLKFSAADDRAKKRQHEQAALETVCHKMRDEFAQYKMHLSMSDKFIFEAEFEQALLWLK